MTLYLCNKAKRCRNRFKDTCMHVEPHSLNHLCGPEVEKDPKMPCYKSECNPVVQKWDQ